MKTTTTTTTAADAIARDARRRAEIVSHHDAILAALKRATHRRESVIFAAAHRVTRAIRAEFADADYRATFAAALRECYRAAADAERISAESIAAAVMSAPDARADWERMTGEEQYTALTAMVWHMRDRDRAECDKRGNPRAPQMQWIVTRDDALTVANEAYTRMPAALDKNDVRDDPRPLSLVMANAVYQAAKRINRAEMKHANAIRRESVTDKDGNETEREYIDEKRVTGERIAPSPYEYAALSDAINAACLDSIDRAIMRGMIYGLNQTEIAALVDMSQRGVSKRIERIRARYYADNLNNN